MSTCVNKAKLKTYIMIKHQVANHKTEHHLDKIMYLVIDAFADSNSAYPENKIKAVND